MSNNNDKQSWFIHVEWATVLVTLLGGFYLLLGSIERQGEITDRLYEMFISEQSKFHEEIKIIHGKKRGKMKIDDIELEKYKKDVRTLVDLKNHIESIQFELIDHQYLKKKFDDVFFNHAEYCLERELGKIFFKEIKKNL